MTNYQMLKNMSIDELASFIDNITTCCTSGDCEDCPIGKYNLLKTPLYDNGCNQQIIKEWLKMNVKGGEVINRLENIIIDIVHSESVTHKDTILPMLRDVVLRMRKHQYEEGI